MIRWPARWTARNDDAQSAGAIEARAAELLRKVKAPAPLDSNAWARIRANLWARRGRTAASRWRHGVEAFALTLGGAAVGAVVVLALVHRGSLHAGPVARARSSEVTVPAGGTARLGSAGGLRAVLVGPGSALIGPSAPSPQSERILLREGRLVIGGGGGTGGDLAAPASPAAPAVPVIVEALGARVVVPPGARAVIEIEGWLVCVAAYAEGVRVQDSPTSAFYEVPFGRARVAGAAEPAGGTPSEIDRILAGGEPDVGPGGLCRSTAARPSAIAAVRPEAPPAGSILAPAIAVRSSPEAGLGSPAPIAPEAPPFASPPLPPAPRGTALAEESRLLSAALERLRGGRDAAGALALLDAYRARFPQGVLSPEATVARIDALLALGERAQALAILEPMTPEAVDALPRAAEWRLLRGELRAEAGRCREALSDFEPFAGGSAAGSSLEERALWGRASCRASTGDAVGARADLERYRARFPNGRFAVAAQRALSGADDR